MIWINLHIIHPHMTPEMLFWYRVCQLAILCGLALLVAAMVLKKFQKPRRGFPVENGNE